MKVYLFNLNFRRQLTLRDIRIFTTFDDMVSYVKKLLKSKESSGMFSKAQLIKFKDFTAVEMTIGNDNKHIDIKEKLIHELEL